MSKSQTDESWLAPTEATQASFTPTFDQHHDGLDDAEKPKSTVPSGGDDGVAIKNPTSSSKKKWGVYGLIFVVIVGIAVGVAVGVSGGDDSSSKSSPAATATVTTPTPPPIGNNEVADVIYANALLGGEEFEDPLSYQSKALNYVLSQTLPAPQYPNLSMEVQAKQLYALACIFFATYSQRNAWTDFHLGVDTDIPGWFDERGWLQRPGEICTVWSGITCDENNLVSRIELDTNGLTGFFPAETQLLKDSLTILDLYNNLLHNIGEEGHAWIGEMTNLEKLFYGYTFFEYDGVPTYLGKLTNLKELDFSYTLYFGEIPEGMWSGLTNLSYLHMSGNAYNSPLPTDLASLPNLEFLYGWDSALTGDLDFIAQMPKIIELWIDDNGGYAGNLSPSIAGSETLKSLSLTELGLIGTIPTEFGLMTNMQRLWLYGNSLTGPIPEELGNLLFLDTLNVQDNDITGVVPDSLCLARSPIGNLNELEADCDGEVSCPSDCCTCCGADCIGS